MRKIVLVILSLIFCLGLVGCSSFKEGFKDGWENSIEEKSDD